MFHDYLARRPYPQDTRENDSLARLFSFQSCAPHMPFSREPFSWTSRELVAKCTDLQLSLSLHQINTKLNTIKSHKIQGTKLKQLQYFLSWNKANIKHNCKSQLYNCGAIRKYQGVKQTMPQEYPEYGFEVGGKRDGKRVIKPRMSGPQWINPTVFIMREEGPLYIITKGAVGEPRVLPNMNSLSITYYPTHAFKNQLCS